MANRKDDARDRELDRILSEIEILPSSGFTASVMEEVHREASAPPPIPFPWKRALPGITVAVAVLGFFVVMTIVQFARGAAVTPLPEAWMAPLRFLTQGSLRLGGLWLVGALLISFACLKFSSLFLPRRT